MKKIMGTLLLSAGLMVAMPSQAASKDLATANFVDRLIEETTIVKIAEATGGPITETQASCIRQQINPQGLQVGLKKDFSSKDFKALNQLFSSSLGQKITQLALLDIYKQDPTAVAQTITEADRVALEKIEPLFLRLTDFNRLNVTKTQMETQIMSALTTCLQ